MSRLPIIPDGHYVDPDALASIAAIPDEALVRTSAMPVADIAAHKALKHPWAEHPELLAANNGGRKPDPHSVPGILRALPLHGSHVFAQYRIASQLSAAIQSARASTGARFSCSRELSLIDGECTGVRVTRIS